jgi:hypothetical protein
MAAHLGGQVPQVAGDGARVVIISGGNLDPELFLSILAGGTGS